MKVGPESRLSLVRRALAGHAALGLLAATLLYVIALTGTLAVVHDRWQRWEQPAVPEFTDLSPSAAQAAITAALSSGQGGVRTKQFSLQIADRRLPQSHRKQRRRRLVHR